ncbi:hypothetical protein [Mesorhizobium sp. M2A.F.Ca.ET.067.02.1.1]|uniref:hypothetical protein n=1 Tax=Mesorhizobium sp. M2A.F.Ca.ET.067.02.1.1 TaxID=2496749 RepID=UPI000FD27BE4|nr:hypothetical protein [Mesorhizobium sp. M2A.F.Ca.ET.067.02.1.1]RUW81542.1 hypothetical protein EOA28_01045 [Mesorhizobium sp. M2A.F.Ca.ET.067.02.1.1]TIU58129.1 MAG: hypothetical protein E5W35_05910 [Mesorhizobium sp.]
MVDAIFISVAANGHSTPHLDQVYVSFYGPKGGTRGTETITIESARKLRDELVEKLPFDHASDTVDALTQAESFISGFDGDPLQEGVADMLAGLRAAIRREQARPDLLAVLKSVAGCPQAAPWLARLPMPDGTSTFDAVRAAISKAEPPAAVATNRPGDQAAIYAEETGVDCATALVHCNMD